MDTPHFRLRLALSLSKIMRSSQRAQNVVLQRTRASVPGLDTLAVSPAPARALSLRLGGPGAGRVHVLTRQAIGDALGKRRVSFLPKGLRDQLTQGKGEVRPEAHARYEGESALYKQTRADMDSFRQSEGITSRFSRVTPGEAASTGAVVAPPSAGAPLPAVYGQPGASSASLAGQAVYGTALQPAPTASVGTGGAGASSGNLGTPGAPVSIRIQKPNTGASSLKTLFNIALFLGVLFYLSSQMTGGKLPGTGRSGSALDALFGSNTTELHERPDVTFNDVKGVDEVRQELQDLVQFLKDPEKYARLGAKVPHGVLLSGPPGTGKTLLARAVAGEAGVPFYSRSASEFEEVLVGLGAKRIRDLFNAARKNAPAIIFIDEIDAVGTNRSRVSVSNGHERQTLNQLLAAMDGFSKNDGVIVIAATNTVDVLDPALTRPGRFDTKVEVPLPDRKGREEILELYIRKIVASKDVDVALLASATPGFSGADLSAMVNSAALIAANRGATEVEPNDFEEARDKVIMGPALTSKVKKPEVLRMTAFHEAGHTLVALLTNNSQLLHKVTILPRGRSGGASYFLPSDEDFMTKSQILARIDCAMGGRVAEEMILGPDNITTGAGSDMSQATELAKAYCAVYSMSRLGLSSFASDRTQPSPATQRLIDTEVETILEESYSRVKDLLQKNSKKLNRLADALLLHETLSAEQCREVIEGKNLPLRGSKPAPSFWQSWFGWLINGWSDTGAAAAGAIPSAKKAPSATPAPVPAPAKPKSTVPIKSPGPTSPAQQPSRVPPSPPPRSAQPPAAAKPPPTRTNPAPVPPQPQQPLPPLPPQPQQPPQQQAPPGRRRWE